MVTVGDGQRRRWRTPTQWAAILGALAMSSALVGCGGSANNGTSSNPSDVAFNIGYFDVPTLITYGLANSDFSNLKMSVANLDSGAAALPLIANGSMAGAIDLSEPPLVIAFSKGIPLKIVWLENTNPVALLVRPTIHSASDLKGKKIAAPGGSIVQWLLEKYLSDNGMSLSDIQFVDLGAPNLLAAYKTGAIDGAYIWAPQMYSLQDAGAATLENNTVINVTAFSSAFINTNKAVVQAFVCDMAKTQSRFLADPGAAYAVYAKKYSLTTAQAQLAVPQEGVFDPSQELTTAALGSPGEFSVLVPRIASVGASMKNAGNVDKAPSQNDAANMVDREFAQVVVNHGCS